jgi:peptide/nickel transport system substrate-binding protein
MKRLFMPLVVLLVLASLIAGCSSSNTPTTSAPAPTTSTTAPQTQTPTTTQTTAITAAPLPTGSTTPTATKTTTTASPTAPAANPVYGGTLKVILGQGPANVGYFPTQTFQDETYAPSWSDRLFDLDLQGNLVPNLALGYDYPPNSKSITLHLRPGVKFQDGTPFNAAAVKWTIETAIPTNAMPGGANIASCEVIDDNTLKVNLKAYSSIAPFNLWRPTYYSPTFFQKNGQDSATINSVSTSAFKVTNFQSNSILEMSRWSGYWQSGKPYLGSVQIRTVQDPTTCAALIQAGQADMWINATMPEASQLQKAGYEILSGPNTLADIFPDSKDPASPFAKQAVREALEYALDKQALSDSLGYGFDQPVTMMAPPGTAGYNPDFAGRPYNVAKAKQLLADAGYPNGFSTNLMYVTGGAAKDQAAAIQNYLAAINIKVTLDPADPGRYWGSIFATGWHGLLLGVHAINPQWAVAWLDHFGPQALIGFVSLDKSQAFLDTANAILAAPDLETFKKATMVNVTQAGKDCMFIPILNSPMLVVKQKWVNTTYTKALDWTGWTIYNDWLAPH